MAETQAEEGMCRMVMGRLTRTVYNKRERPGTREPFDSICNHQGVWFGRDRKILRDSLA